MFWFKYFVRYKWKDYKSGSRNFEINCFRWSHPPPEQVIENRKKEKDLGKNEKKTEQI